MNVQELIELLQQEDPTKRVVIDGYEGGVDDVCSLRRIKINLNVNNDDWYLGKHEDSPDGLVDGIHIT